MDRSRMAMRFHRMVPVFTGHEDAKARRDYVEARKARLAAAREADLAAMTPAERQVALAMSEGV